jgi:hypothetical protein
MVGTRSKFLALGTAFDAVNCSHRMSGIGMYEQPCGAKPSASTVSSEKWVEVTPVISARRGVSVEFTKEAKV